MSTKPSKQYTLVFILKDSPDSKSRQILLGLKKRGFGMGKWNGFGGKLEPGETVDAAAIRELEEESGLHCHMLTKVAKLHFDMASSIMLVDTYIGRFSDCSGSVTESEEMRPRWFPETDIPYQDTWPDDKFWLPLVLTGKLVVGKFEYAADDYTILNHTVDEVTALP